MMTDINYSNENSNFAIQIIATDVVTSVSSGSTVYKKGDLLKRNANDQFAKWSNTTPTDSVKAVCMENKTITTSTGKLLVAYSGRFNESGLNETINEKLRQNCRDSSIYLQRS